MNEYLDGWAYYEAQRVYAMLPPPPTEPPRYDLSLIELPTLELPKDDKPESSRSTRGLGLFHRLSVLWCRANGDDHSRRLRRGLDKLIERIRGGNHE
jgi:hypothetical protein